MTQEDQFILRIDCAFPAEDEDRALGLIREARSLGLNAVFQVAYELAFPPTSSLASDIRRLTLLEELGAGLDQPIAQRVLSIAEAVIRNKPSDPDETAEVIRLFVEHPNLVAGLGILTSTCSGECETVAEALTTVHEAWRCEDHSRQEDGVR